MSGSTRMLQSPTPLLIGAVMLCACSFSGDEHPAACETSSDCRTGYACYQKFCIAESGSSVAPPEDVDGSTSPSAGDGSVEDGSTSGEDGGASARDGGTPIADTGPPPPDSSTPLPDSGTPIDEGGTAEPDAGSTPDAGDADSGPTVPPYAACSGDQDCNPDEVCRMSSSNGVCAAPCDAVGDCTEPSGNYGAAPVCDNDRCRLDCAPDPPVPPLPRSCPASMSCILESGAQTCYPQ